MGGVRRRRRRGRCRMELRGFLRGHVATGMMSQATRGGTIAWLACVTLTALALALRVFDLAAYGLETDEVFSVIAARSSWDQMFSIVVEDKSHPPLHYIVLKLSQIGRAHV